MFTTRTFAEKRPSQLHMRLMHFNSVKCQVLYNRILTNSHLPITAGTAFESLNPAGVSQLSPSQALTVKKDIPSPGKTRSDSESRLQDILTMVKQDQQSHRIVQRGAAHISFLGHTGLSKLPVGQPRVAPGDHRELTGWTNTHDEH